MSTGSGRIPTNGNRVVEVYHGHGLSSTQQSSDDGLVLAIELAFSGIIPHAKLEKSLPDQKDLAISKTTKPQTFFLRYNQRPVDPAIFPAPLTIPTLGAQP